MDCLTTLATEAISKKLEGVVDSIVQQFKYMIQHKEMAANLEKELDNLKAIKEALQGRVDAERRSGLAIEPTVEKWLSDVGAFENELQKFYSTNEVELQKKCFCGKCPNLALNYSLGKQATRTTQHVRSLEEEGKKFQQISHQKAPPSLGSTFPDDIISIGSRNKIKAKVIDKLKDDKLKRISICGMGGVGKTTLATEVIKVVEKENLFKEVATAAVSQNPSYMSIQNEIAESLGFKFSSKSMQGRARQLQQRLNEIEKVLIVLDDVWGILDFEKIGLPSQDLHKGIKILFTSRNEKVCQEMGSQENVKVSILSKDESWFLFREMAGDVVDKADIYPIAEQVANECGGLPLAIAAIARALKNEEKLAWEVALDKLRNSQQSSFSNMEEFVYSRIEISLDKLGVEHKSFLFLSSLFPEDFDIPIENVLRYGLGLGLFEATGNQIWKARNQVNYFVSNLRRCFLLLDSNKPGCVKMHDVVRDVVLKFSFRAKDGIFVDNNAPDGILVENQWRRISLVLNEAIDVLENGLECPNLELLKVWSMRDEKPIPWPKNFIQGMRKLKVLALQNWCIPELTSLSQASFNLHTLQLEHCDVGDISVIGKEFKKLEILSFAYSSIKKIPTEIGQLNCLRLLDLTGCDDLEFICDNVLARLSRLQELYFRIKNFPWMLNKDIFMELKNISKQLRVLEFSIRKVETLPSDLNFKNLERFCVYVLSYYDHPAHHFESNKLHLRSTSYNSLKSSSMIIHLVGKCEILKLEKVKDLKNVIGELNSTGIKYLKDLMVDSCPNLEYVVDCNTPDAFPLIKLLSLRNLAELREIFNTSNLKSLIKFSDLEILKLEDLPKFIGFGDTIEHLNESSHRPIYCGLNSTTALADSIDIEDAKNSVSPIGGKLFSCRWMEQFPKLKSILLNKCSSLEILFDLQGYSQSIGFPQLEEIEISYLSNLTHVWGNVPNSVQGFQNLRSLTISGCDSLKCVFTRNIIGAITNLEKLKIESCKMMRNLVDWDNDDEEDRNKSEGQVKMNVVFGKLYYVSLSYLPELESVCEGSSHQLEWPSLREIEIVHCPMLDISLLQTTNMQEKKDSVGETSYAVTEDSNFHNVKENNLGCFYWVVGRKSMLPKLIRQRSANKESKTTEARKGARDGLEERMKRHLSRDGSLFSNLTSFSIVGHDKISSTLFNFSSLTRNLDHLRKLKVWDCKNLKEIISIDQETETNEENKKIKFPELQDLDLEDLPNLSAFCQGSYHFEFPSLLKVSIDGCPNMEIFSGGPSHTPKLQDVDITTAGINCNYVRKNKDLNSTIQGFQEFLMMLQRGAATNELRWTDLHEKDLIGYFFTLYHWFFGFGRAMFITNFHKISTLIPFNEIHMRQLQRVKNLCIGECDSLVEVFELEPAAREIGGGDHHAIATIHSNYELEYMYLNELPKLRHIWKYNHYYMTAGQLVSFQKLTHLRIEECHSLKSLLSYSMVTSLVHLQQLEVLDCNMMEEIVTKELDKNDYIISQGGSKVKTLFPKLETMSLSGLPELKCVCSGDYYDYDVPLGGELEDMNTNNNNKVIQISFPQLNDLTLSYVPKLKCICSGAYDYHIILRSNQENNIQQQEEIATTFPRSKILTVSTPNLHYVAWNERCIRTLGDIDSTIHYFQNSWKYKMELQNLETLKGIIELQRDDDELGGLVGYIKRQTELVLENCDRLLNYCIPSHLFSHLRSLTVRKCGCIQEIFESTTTNNDHYELGAYCRYDHLDRIMLHSLPKLKHIWKNPDQVIGCFNRLRTLDIYECHELKYVFPDHVSSSSSAKSLLPKLDSLYVRECNKMEEIIQLQKMSMSNSNSIQQPKPAKIIFPNLWCIELEKLPNLICFCPTPCYLELPQCEFITIQECHKMETFCYQGNVFTPSLNELLVENYTCSDSDQDLNEAIQSRKL